MNAVELPTEFGATDDVDILRQTTALADQHLIGWQYWHYKNWADPTTQSQGSGAQGLFAVAADLSPVKIDTLRVLARTSRTEERRVGKGGVSPCRSRW